MSRRVETARGTVHKWQCDHMGHVNVRAYGERFEEACWQFYAMLGIRPSRLRAGEIHMAAVQQDTAYRKELLGGDVVVVHYRFTRVDTYPDGRVEGQGVERKITHTWMKVGDDWLIIGGMCGDLAVDGN